MSKSDRINHPFIVLNDLHNAKEIIININHIEYIEHVPTGALDNSSVTTFGGRKFYIKESPLEIHALINDK